MRRWSRTASVFVVLASMSVMCATGAAQTPSNDPISVVPAESLFCVQINNLSGTLGKMDQFLLGVSPIPVSLAAMAPMYLGQMLGSPDASGVNMSGNFAVFGPLPGGDKPDISRLAVLIPVTDFDKFLKGNPKITPPDAQGIAAIGQGPGGFVLAKAGNYAVATSAANRQSLIEAKTLLTGAATTPLAKRLSPDELKRATGSPLWVYANMQGISKILEPILQKQIDQLKEAMKTPPAGMTMMPQTDAMVNTYVNIINGLMKQTQSVSLTLDPSATAIQASLVTAAMPDSEMAKILSLSNSGQQLKYLDYLENGAVMNFATTCSPAFFKAISDKYVNLLMSLMGPNVAKEDADKIKQLAMESADVFGGSMAMTFTADPKSQPPFGMTYVAAIKDKKKLSDLMDQAAKLTNDGAVASFYKQMGIKMRFDLKRGAETYQGVPVDAIRIAILPTDANSMQGQMLKKMYGEGLNLRMAVVNDLMVYTLAPEPDKAIHALIDKAKSTTPGQIPSEIQAALQLLPAAKTSEFFGTYNFLRIAQLGMAMSSMSMPIALPPLEGATQSDMAFTGKIGSGKLQVGVAVPKQHVQEIMMAVLKMQQSMMQPQQPTQPSTPQQPAQPPQPQKSTRGKM